MLGIVLTSTGGAGVIGGSLLLLAAESRSDTLTSMKPGTRWTDEMQDVYDSLAPLGISGAVVLSLGAILSSIGVCLIIDSITDGGNSKDETRSRVSLTGNEAIWEYDL